ncbi:MAG: hypothetical protein M1821_009023 [Bathelium mastoideum]|nr:MAG: hypothetical protein M1821_009023 [Bathelium mastoideum]
MPSICRNIHQRNPLNVVTGVPNAGNIGDLNTGQTPNNLPYLVFNYDTDKPHAAARGRQACPSSWYATHPCPEPDQPPVVPAGSSWSRGSWAGRRWNPNGAATLGSAGFNQIANQGNNGPSGMFWSCDEWPARTFEQGGTGASIYCTPMNIGCAQSIQGVQGVSSEQNIQANIHLLLRNRLGPEGSKPSQGTTSYQFYFQTFWEDKPNPISAAVQWADAWGEFQDTSTYKRSLESANVYSDVLFEDGTGMSFVRPITTDEGAANYRMSAGQEASVRTDRAATTMVPAALDLKTVAKAIVPTIVMPQHNVEETVPVAKLFVLLMSVAAHTAIVESVAYYQISNSYTRQCERITPSQINTTGLTHLNLAFATIDPATYKVVPSDNRDVALYKEFTSLKSSTLQTWIAIGGWRFNDPGPTQTTFSSLAASSSNRATFISSLTSFMSQYGFQGVDIDWEYPGAPERYGVTADTEIFVELLKEMRAAFGTTYGISTTLPSSYWYLRWFDPSAMEPYVDFFGLMTFDLHGPWDAQIKQIGPTIFGQTNIPEISNWTLPLWYDKVDPSKLNLGLAYYGRGYTVNSVDCMTIGCEWSGPSDPGPCTTFGGVMSLQEIETNIIPSLGIDPILDSNAMMKYLVWSNQWIGYDDLETIAMKKAWASGHCSGGTMIWSIDLYSGLGSGSTPDGGGSSGSTDPGAGGGQGGGDQGGGGQGGGGQGDGGQGSGQGAGGGSGNDNVVYIDPSIWTEPNPEINCDPPFRPTSSILPPPFTITDNQNPLSQSGVTQPIVIRTITPPPYPYSEPVNTQTASTSSSSSETLAVLPWVTFKPGPPGPICKSGCGKRCLIFCHHPCLLDCDDGGNDFGDPEDPNPPKRPTPTEEVDPVPTPNHTLSPEPPDPNEDEPGDEEEEGEDEQCADEFHLPIPTYVVPSAGTTSTQSISPPQPPPTPQPPPNPTPPSPNPAAESLHCYNSGAMTGRGSMIDAVNSFCDTFSGTILDDSDPNNEHTLTYSDYNAGVCLPHNAGCTEILLLTVTVTNGCKFAIDGPEPNQNCGRIFREAIDQCDTDSTKYKQGGTITSNCAVWRIDPNNNWNCC